MHQVLATRGTMVCGSRKATTTCPAIPERDDVARQQQADVGLDLQGLVCERRVARAAFMQGALGELKVGGSPQPATQRGFERPDCRRRYRPAGNPTRRPAFERAPEEACGL
jgi:hypothetical protein